MMDFLRRFFIGRYGFDMLGKYLLWTSVIFTVLGTFKVLWFLKPLSTVLLIICIARMLSKNIHARLNENRKFYDFLNKVKAYFKRDRKYFRYIKCPKCRKVTKVPKNKGKIAITCPYCKYEFIKKT